MPLKRICNQALFPYRIWMLKKQCIFIHIPKAAGSSILCSLGAPERPRFHLPWYVYFHANKNRFQKYFKFAFVRNPWARIYSAYNYLIQGGNKTTDKQFSEWINNNFPDFETFVERGLGSGIVRSSPLFLPQSNFIVDDIGKLKIDFLGRVESIESDFREIKKRLHLPSDLEIINASNKPNQDFRKAYTQTRSIEIISEIYAQDILLFNYSFEP